MVVIGENKCIQKIVDLFKSAEGFEIQERTEYDKITAQSHELPRLFDIKVKDN